MKFDSRLSDEFSVGDEIEFGITVEDKCWSKSEKRSIVDTIEGYLDSRVYICLFLISIER